MATHRFFQNRVVEFAAEVQDHLKVFLPTNPDSKTILNEFALMIPAFIALTIGAFVQSQTFLNHDVAWVLNSSERLLDGGTFGTDIVAANPPLIWWLSALVAGLARLLDADPVNTFRAVVTLLIAGMLFAFNLGLRSRVPAISRLILFVFLALLLTLGVHRDFGQREHLAVVLCLPWIITTMRRADGQTQNTIYAFLTGIGAGIGFAFKPHFLIVPVLVSIFTVFRRRSLRPILATENLAIFATGLAYVVAVWIFARPYLTEVVPMVSQVYWGFERPLSSVFSSQRIIIVFSFLAFTIAALGRFQSAEFIPALCSVGFLIAALAQSKGYSYHFYPVLAFALISLSIYVLVTERFSFKILATVLLAIGVTFVSLRSTISLAARSAQGAYGQHAACIVQLVEANVSANGGFMALSTHPFPGFPVANYSKREWVAATNSRLYLPAIARIRALKEKTTEERDILALAERLERTAAIKDMSRHPELVLVDARQFRHAINGLTIDFIDFYSEDENFTELWASYHEISSCGRGIRAFKLSQGT